MSRRKFLRRKQRIGSLDQGLALLNERLASPNPQRRSRLAARVGVQPTSKIARNVYYAPDMDGNAEPGEVVWVTVPSQPPAERSMLVVGRDQHLVIGLLISPDKTHSEDPRWLGIGCGEWEASGEPCWVRLDKTIHVPEIDVHRRGTILPQLRFERIAARLRDRYDWG
mgnify:FL=1